MQEYIGKVVQLIYVDSKRRVTIRNVRVLAVGEHRFKAYCYLANEVRTFKISGIVDMEPVNKRALEVI
jgi:predicted DNA-binding transcriptional regulator YafY